MCRCIGYIGDRGNIVSINYFSRWKSFAFENGSVVIIAEFSVLNQHWKFSWNNFDRFTLLIFFVGNSPNEQFVIFIRTLFYDHGNVRFVYQRTNSIFSKALHRHNMKIYCTHSLKSNIISRNFYIDLKWFQQSNIIYSLLIRCWKCSSNKL